jgi:hypothetical protein
MYRSDIDFIIARLESVHDSTYIELDETVETPVAVGTVLGANTYNRRVLIAVIEKLKHELKTLDNE